ncbi:RNA exonuclease 1 homolog isoform X2 [Tamandua tetradactyla]|uniref:RNA exonuclease 1 homolog isoform X2 n=1 Tax=Tamandua tetradactyla TaxID=48850 RepID=UPI00405384DA
MPRLGYDPYNPELPKPPVQRENGILGCGEEARSDTLELELVNQAIEAVRSEVELEQRRYQELLQTAREYSSGEAAVAAALEDAFPLSLEPVPGGCSSPSSLAAAYQPTPLGTPTTLGSKYSLTSLDRCQSKGGGLEYIPKAVTYPRKYGRPTPSGKYVVDNSKPSTDLEYDPLSNYSARLLSRASPRDDRAPKRPRAPRSSEPYTPALKKHCDPFGSYDAQFSDSEDDAAALGDGPTTANPLKPRAGPKSKAPGKPPSREGPGLEEGNLRETKEMAVQCDVGDLGQPPKSVNGEPPAKPVSPARASQEQAGGEQRQGGSKEGKSKKQLRREPLPPGHKDSVPKKGKGRDRGRGKPGEKLSADQRSPKATSPRHKEERPNRTKNKASLATSGASSGKGRPDQPGQRPSPTSGGAGPQEPQPSGLSTIPGGQHQPPSRMGEKALSGKLAERKARSLDEGGSQDTPKLKKRALSHADLFGDESEDEDPGPGPKGRPPTLPTLSSDSGSDSDSSLSLPGDQGPPKRLKTSPPQPAPPSSPSSSSSSSEAGDVDYAALEKEVDFDSDPMEECLRIFNESTSVKTEHKGRLAHQAPKEEKREETEHVGLTTLFPGQKRRISHLAKQGKEAELLARGPAAPPARPLTAQEVCYRRAQQAQKQSASWLQVAQRPLEKPLSTPLRISAPGEKRRIAHVPNPHVATAPTGAKRALAASSSQPSHGPEPGCQPLKTRTLAGMASKTTTTATPKRIAHSPSLQSLKKPIIPKEFGAKVPTVIRQRYLNLFIDECLKFCSSDQEAIEKALNEEKVAYDRSPSKNIYLSVAVNTLKKLRGLVPSTVPGLHKNSSRRVVSHEMVLGGRLAAKTSFSLSRPNSPRVEDLKGAALYSRLKGYLLTEDQLKENGYPFPHPERPGGAVLFTAEEKKPKDPSCRICCRCGTEYLVSSSGRCVQDEECYYHWGRLRRNRVAGGWETQYMCCSAAIGSVGCQVAKQHVQDGRKENLEGFVKTFEKELSADAYPGIYALDCEMSYTTYGLELTRVTVVDTDMRVVYDTFVRPDNEVVDYNTRFSGVTEADLADTSITLRDVQAVLLSMLSASTILIGHSLESDLLALKVIHRTVVDTSVLFPHRLGLPYKRSLRNLMADYLRQIIQDNVDGHSSSEDASACMHLMIWKIREDAKTKR